MIKSFKNFLNIAKLAWVNLVSRVKRKVKGLFSRSKDVLSDISVQYHKDNFTLGNEQDIKQVDNLELNECQDNVEELDEDGEQIVWYDTVENVEDNRVADKQQDIISKLDEDREVVWYDALDKWYGTVEKSITHDMSKQVASVEYESDKFHSTESLQEVDGLTNHSKTFAIALFDHSRIKYPNMDAGRASRDDYRLTGFQLKNDDTKKDKSKAGKCTLHFGQHGSADFHHVRLFMPLFFEKHMKESLYNLLQYTDNKGGKHTPSVVILIDTPESINLDPSFGWREWKEAFIWKLIKRSEASKSTRITQTMFPTFTIELSEEQQNLILVINKDAIPGIMKDLVEEKPTFKTIYSKLSSLCNDIITKIIDRVIGKPKAANEKKEINFHIRDVLMRGEILNALQQQPDVQHTQNAPLSHLEHIYTGQAAQAYTRNA